MPEGPRIPLRHGQIPFIEIPEWGGGWFTKQALSDAPAGVLALLNRHLGDARQWLSILLEGSRVSNYVYVWISGNGEIVLIRTRPAWSVSALNHSPAGEGATPAVQITALLAMRSPPMTTPSASI